MERSRIGMLTVMLLFAVAFQKGMGEMYCVLVTSTYSVYAFSLSFFLCLWPYR